MRTPARRNVDFQTILDALIDIDAPFSPVYLQRFSDLNPKDLREFKNAWPVVDPGRRVTFLEDLVETAEVDDLMSYDAIGWFLLEDSHGPIRALAIRLVWASQETRLAPVLLKMMETDSDAEVRYTAATGLGVYVYLGEIEEIPGDLLKRIEEALLKAAKTDSDVQLRRKALEALGFSSRPEVPDLIKNAYASGENAWLESALIAMGRSSNEIWGNTVFSNMDHPVDSVRYEAIRAAGELQFAPARQYLLDKIEEYDDEDLRIAAIWTLSQIGGEGVREYLEDLLENSEDDDEIDFLQESLENLNFTEDLASFNMLDVDADEKDAGPDAHDHHGDGGHQHGKKSGGKKDRLN
jgi:hypothetical protein